MTQIQIEQKAKQIAQNKLMAQKMLLSLHAQLSKTRVSSIQIAELK